MDDMMKVAEVAAVLKVSAGTVVKDFREDARRQEPRHRGQPE